MLENLVIPDKENPLLRQRADHKPTFAHDKDRENAAARYFAEEINSGRMSVKDAYSNHWSYEENAGLWDLPKDKEWRALLPAWEPVLQTIVPRLLSEKAEDVLSVLTENYFEAQECIQKNRRVLNYNPFYWDLRAASKLTDSIDNELSKKIKSINYELTEERRHRLTATYLPESKKEKGLELSQIYLLDKIPNLDKKLQDRINEFTDLKDDEIPGFIEFGEYKNIITIDILIEADGEHVTDSLLEKVKTKNSDQEEVGEAITLLGEIGAFKFQEKIAPVLIEYAKGRTIHKSGAISALGKIGYNEAIPLIKKYLKPDSQYKRVATSALGDIGGDEVVPSLKRYANKLAGFASEYPTLYDADFSILEDLRFVFGALFKIETKKSMEAIFEILQNMKYTAILELEAEEICLGLDSLNFRLKPQAYFLPDKKLKC